MTLQEYNDLYKRPLLKQMTIVSSGGITIKNANIVSEEMSLEKSLCSETNLRYGRCEAACFKVRIADINHDFTGEWLTVTQDVVTDSEGYLLTQNGQYLLTEDGFKIKLKNEQIDEASATYGRFRVHSDKPSNDRRWRDLTCYDIMYDILNADVISWYNGLTFPMTLKNLRDSFFNYLGITQETTTLINDSFVTPGGFSVSGSLSGKTVIESICELNGVFGQITGDGKFQYVSLSSPPTLTLDYYVDGTGSYEDYVTDAVTGINAKGTTDDVGTIVGTSTNLYIINGNPLIYGTEGTQALTIALNTLLQHIMSVQYRPFGVTTYGNPMLPLGTKLTVNTKNQIIVSYVVKKTLKGIQSLKDTLSATGEKHQPTAVNSPKTEITRTKGKVHELEVTVDGLTSRVTATETNLSNNYSTTTQMNSAIQQSATDITTQVSNTYVTQTAYNAEVQNLQDQIDGRIEYWDGNVVPTLNNAPASSWTTDAAKSSHVGDLYRYHHGTPEVVDYYRFDKDTSTTPATYSWVALGASQVDEALRLAEEANDKADAAQAQLDALQQSVEDDYYTKTQTDSKISQSATAITQSVSSTYETKSNATSNYNALDSAAQGYANSALATANTNAQGYANDAKNAANTATDTKLGNYYTKTQTDSQISQTATSITTSVSETYETKTDASDKLATANANAQGYASDALTTARSEITQLSNKVAVKVNSSGRLVTAELGVDPASATSYVKVKADDIDIISNGNIQLTGKSIGITSTNFSVTPAGVVTCSNITATGGSIGGWDISSTDLHKDFTSLGYGVAVSNAAFGRYDLNAHGIDCGFLWQDGKVFAIEGQIGKIYSSGAYYIDGTANVFHGDTSFPSGNIKVNKLVPVSGSEVNINNAMTVNSNGKVSTTHDIRSGGELISGYGMELGMASADAAALIDFHYGSNNTDFTARIWQRAENTVDLLGKNGSTWGIWRAASFSSQSSKYVKKNIKDVTEKEAKNILKLRPVKFDYKNSDLTNQRGLIAEEVLEVMPEMVNVPKDYTGFNKNEPWNTPSIDYSKFVPYLIKMIQILQKEIDDLKK